MYTEVATLLEKPANKEEDMECSIPTIGPDIRQDLPSLEQSYIDEDMRWFNWKILTLPYKVPFLEH